jgi:hypothetical protein
MTSKTDDDRKWAAELDRLGFHASAAGVRARLRDIEPSPCKYPRKRVVGARPISGGQYSVRLVCGHAAVVNGVHASAGRLGKRAPYTAVCPICSP